jgi:alcohol dehydrogenase class IV
MKDQEVFIGTISLKAFQSSLIKLNTQRIFLVHGKSSYESCGAKQFIESSVLPLGCKVVYEHFGFSNNPKIEDIEKGLFCLKNISADVIIAIGGGSVLDTAKLIRFLYSYKGDITENIFIKQQKLIPLIALPTTAGSGSEATRFAVVYKNKKKYSIDHNDILPNISIIDPIFTYNNPKYLAACSGFDALAHSIEAWWNINATEESDEYALKAIRLLWKNLPKAINPKIKESMDAVSQGSYWAGKAINITRTTAPHAMAYAFTAFYDIPHGNAVALTFPFFFKHNIKVTISNYRGLVSLEQYKRKMNRLLQFIGVDNQDKIMATIKQIIESIGLLSSLQFNKKIVLGAINYNRLSNNPIEVTRDDINTILDAIRCK